MVILGLTGMVWFSNSLVSIYIASGLTVSALVVEFIIVKR